MNETSPLPSPGVENCPNCGAPLQAGATYCANCGAPLQVNATSSSAQTLKILVSVGLGCGAFLFGTLGGCLALIGIMGGSFSTDWPYFAFGVAAVLVAAACVWGITRVQRRK